MTSDGLQAMRHGDQHALAHAAGQLMRIVVDAGGGVGNAHRLEQLDRRRARASRRVARPWTSSVSAI